MPKLTRRLIISHWIFTAALFIGMALRVAYLAHTGYYETF